MYWEIIPQSGMRANGFTRRRTWSLSSGERRLVHIVATLVAPSSLVILDEPTCGMDTAGATAIAEAVRTRAQNAGVVVATQDTDWLERLAGAAIELG